MAVRDLPDDLTQKALSLRGITYAEKVTLVCRVCGEICADYGAFFYDLMEQGQQHQMRSNERLGLDLHLCMVLRECDK